MLCNSFNFLIIYPFSTHVSWCLESLFYWHDRQHSLLPPNTRESIKTIQLRSLHSSYSVTFNLQTQTFSFFNLNLLSEKTSNWRFKMRGFRKLRLAHQAFMAVNSNPLSNRCINFRSLFTSSSPFPSKFHVFDYSYSSNFVSSLHYMSLKPRAPFQGFYLSLPICCCFCLSFWLVNANAILIKVYMKMKETLVLKL